MGISKKDELKKDLVNIDEIEELVGLYTAQCFGVVGMASRNVANGLIELVKKGNLKKGVKVKLDDDKLVIDLHVVIEFGLKVGVIANNIIDTIKYSVEKETNLKVKTINVFVDSVRVQA